MAPEKKQQYFVLLGFFALSFGITSLGGVIAADAVNDWYQGLSKPGFTPPDWLFIPAQAVLFSAMAMAGWLIWREHGIRAVWVAHLAYLAQLGLHLMWSWLFFGLQETGLAFGGILILLNTSIAALLLFWRLKPLAGALLLPTVLWISYATILNAAIWRMN